MGRSRRYSEARVREIGWWRFMNKFQRSISSLTVQRLSGRRGKRVRSLIFDTIDRHGNVGNWKVSVETFFSTNERHDGQVSFAALHLGAIMLGGFVASVLRSKHKTRYISFPPPPPLLSPPPSLLPPPPPPFFLSFFLFFFFAASVSLIGSGESEIAWDDLHFSPVAVNTCVLLLLCVSRCLSSLSKRAFGFWPVFLLPGWKRAIRVKRFVFRQFETLSWIASERLCPCPCHRLLCRFNRCCHSVLRFQRFLFFGTV